MALLWRFYENLSGYSLSGELGVRYVTSFASLMMITSLEELPFEDRNTMKKNSMRSIAAVAALGVGLSLGAPAANAAPTPAPAQAAPAVASSHLAPFGPADPAKLPKPKPGEVHGPKPTAEMLTKQGPYEYKTQKLPVDLRTGFYGGTLYYPVAKKGEKFGGIVTMPGFTEPGIAMEFFGKRMASHGFVVLRAESLTPFDEPNVRSRAVENAMKRLTRGDHKASEILDPERLALIGHSMGGGGVLIAAERNPQMRAVISLHPWAKRPIFNVKVPVMVNGGLLDFVADMAQYTGPIYAGIQGAPYKALHTHLAGTHWAGIVDDPKLQARNLAFLKYFVDGDTRYAEFLEAPAQKSMTFTSTTGPI